MSKLSPSNLETVDYGQKGWSAIVTTNMQRLNTFLGRIFALVDGQTPSAGQVAIFNGTTGKWEPQELVVSPEHVVGLTGFAPAVQNGFLGAGSMIPSETGGATAGKTEYGGEGLTFPVLEFGAASDTSAEFSMVMQENWNRGTIKAKLLWIPGPGAATGDHVRWTLSGASISHGDALGASLGTAVDITDTVEDDGVLNLTNASAELTVSGAPALGDLLHFRLQRDFDYAGGGTALAQDAKLLGVWIQYGVSNAVTPW